jgi:zinc protease
MCWLTPAYLFPGDAEMDILSSVLTSGKSSRLFRPLVYELEIAQDVDAFQWSRRLASAFCITATAREGFGLQKLETVIQTELDRLSVETPDRREVERAVNQQESAFLRALERVGSFGGKADRLNQYYMATGNPDYFNQDLARYKAIGPSDLRAVVRRFLRKDARVVLSIVPEGERELAATAAPAKERNDV